MSDFNVTEETALSQNVAVVKRVLEDLKLAYDVPEMAQKDEDTVLINVPFSDENDALAFVLFLFVHESKGLMRTYAHMFSPQKDADIGKLLLVINELNHSHLLDASIDYSRISNSVRFRARLRNYSTGLAPRSVGQHILKIVEVTDKVARVLKTAMASPEDFEMAFDSGLRAIAGADGDPAVGTLM